MRSPPFLMGTLAFPEEQFQFQARIIPATKKISRVEKSFYRLSKVIIWEAKTIILGISVHSRYRNFGVCLGPDRVFFFSFLSPFIS